MQEIAVGIRASSNPWHLEETLRWLSSSTVPFKLKLFDVEPSTSSIGECLNRLVRECPASFYFVVESGALPGPQALEEMCGIFHRVSTCGVVGPSTNLCGNEQGVFGRSVGDARRNSAIAKLRFGSTYRSLRRHSRLADFFVGFRRKFLEAVGPVRSTPDWLTELTTRPAAKQFAILWACGAYVHHKPPQVFPAVTKLSCASRSPGSLSSFHSPATLDLTNCSKLPVWECPSDAVEPSITQSHRKSVVSDEPTTKLPLVSCIMPTFNRRAFVPRALHCFLYQDYSNTELIIVDDGTDPIANLLPADPRIRYFRHSLKQNVGAKRNFACQQAHGEYIVHWDDDEWYGASRVRRQIAALQHSGAHITGTSVAIFYNETSGRAFRYMYAGSASTWMGALAYRRGVWKDRPFDCIPIAEDVRFIGRVPLRLRMDLRDPSLYLASIHESNTSPKITTGSFWRPEPIETILTFPGFQPADKFSAAAVRERVA